MATVILRNVRGVDLNIGDREFVVLTGPTGSGDIIRAIAGLEASGGEILLDDKPIDDVPARDRDVALLTHDYTPYPSMSVYENLAIGLERRKFAESEIKKRVGAVAQELGLQDQLQANPKTLSPEQQRRVGLARTMVRQPKVYLFNEPFAQLDRAAAARGRSAIGALRQRSAATILYATSDPAEAMSFDTRTIVIDAGIIQQDADAQTVFDAPANLIVAKFFGDPPMNLVEGTLKQERDAVVFREAGDGTIAVRWPNSGLKEGTAVAGEPVVLGFHPNALDIVSTSGDRSAQAFRALVDRAEPNGAGTELYLRTGGHEIVCRSRRWSGENEAGHRFEFEIDPARAHLFYSSSGQVVTQGT
jgi:multiple sugar transport system ATP-binding protein